MKNLKQKAAGTLLLLALGAVSAAAQTITSNATWDFTTANATSVTPANANVTISAMTQGNNNGTTTLLTNVSPSGTYAGASGGNNAGAAARAGALNTAAGGSAYFEVTFTPVGGVIVNSISFGSRSTSTGPQAYSIRTSIDGYASDAGTGTLLANSIWALNTTALTGAAANGALTVRIYGYNGTGTPSANTANWRIDDVTFNVSASATPLPVNFSAFSASRQQNDILLKWSTATEKNASHFEIERSQDGQLFYAIGKVVARNAATGANYSYVDPAVTDAAVYYRLRNVDADGQYAFSPVVSVAGAAATAMASLDATLVTNTLPVSFTGKTAATDLYLFSLSGTMVQHQVVNGASSAHLDISGLSAGMYLLKVKGTNAMETFKFVKQ